MHGYCYPIWIRLARPATSEAEISAVPDRSFGGVSGTPSGFIETTTRHQPNRDGWDLGAEGRIFSLERD
jgi:hypothetical protein